MRRPRSGQAPSRGVPRLAAIDLNLLVALDVLLEEKSVSRAARRLGRSQPAVSHVLAKLRELLGDAVLVREGGATRLTEGARRLAPDVRRVLDDVEATLLGHRAFDPARSTRTFRLATNDYCGAVVLPAVVDGARRTAPQATLEVHGHVGPVPGHALARGELDLALGTFLEVSAGVRTQDLFDDRFVCLLRRGHDATRRRLDLAGYAALDHVLVSSPGYGPGVVDEALARAGLARRVAVRVPHFLVAPAIVAKTDLVLTVPERLARDAARTHGLRVLAPPLELGRFAVTLAWHERSDADPALAWLRRVVVEASAEVQPRIR